MLRGYKVNINTSPDILKDPNFSIEVYSYILMKSSFTLGAKDRYLFYGSININEWSKKLGMSKNTLRKKIKYLIDKNYIIERTSGIGEKYIQIEGEHKNGYKILPDFFVDGLLDLKHKHLIKVYLLYLNLTRNYGSCMLNQKSILEMIGLSYNSNNAKVIKGINDTLIELGLIKVTTTRMYEKSQYKSILEIRTMEYEKTEFFKENQKKVS